MYTAMKLAAAMICLVGGIYLMRFGLEKLLLYKLQKIIGVMTVTPWRGLLAGTIAAVLLQSSTAVSLLVIGLVSAGYMTFYQGLGIILGANIGTCSTVQLMTLSIPDQYLAPLFLIALSASAIRRLRYGALSLAGFISLFYGLAILADTISGIMRFDEVCAYLAAAKQNPCYGIAGGMMLTALFQSSSAATGLIMLFADGGAVDLTTAAYIVYGNNIGSCLSSVVAGSLAPVAARRVAVSHLVLNLLGVLLFIPFTGLFSGMIAGCSDDFAVQVALLHTIFNVTCSIIILPVFRHFAGLIILLVPGNDRNR